MHMTKVTKKMTLYTDGGSRNNPGPAGAGAVVYDEKGHPLAEVSAYLGEKTNNWAEYEAIILGLQEVKKLVPEKQRKDLKLEVRMDSELIQRQLTNKYQIKEESLIPQFIKVHNMVIKDFPNISFTHVRREDNTEADRLANEAMDRGV